MDFSKYYQLEQLNKSELDYLEQTILEIYKESYNIEEIFIVGSFCFGLDKVNDIDICVMIPENEVRLRTTDPPSKEGVYYICATILSGLISRKLNKKVVTAPHNLDAFLTDMIKDIDPPMYNLTRRYWINKTPGDKWNYFILRDNNKSWIIDRDSEEGKKIKSQYK